MTFTASSAAELQRALSACGPGDVIRVRGVNLADPGANSAAGDAAFKLAGKRDVALVGEGWPVIGTTAHGNGLLLQDCQGVTVEGIAFQGNGPITDASVSYGAFFALLRPVRTRGITVRDCRFRDSGNHGIAYLDAPRDSTGFRMLDCDFVNGGNFRHPVLQADGAAVAVGGEGTEVVGCRIRNWLRGLEHEANDGKLSARRCRYERNDIGGCYWQSILYTPTGGNSSLFDQGVIGHNFIHDGQQWPGARFSPTGIYVTGALGLQIEGNQIADFPGDCYAILCQSIHGYLRGLSIGSNAIQRVGNGIHFGRDPQTPAHAAGESAIYCNGISGVAGRGIIVDADNVTLALNGICDSAYAAIHVAGGAGNSLINNVALRCQARLPAGPVASAIWSDVPLAS